MIICFECSQVTKEALDRLLGGGQYRDYSEVLSVAVANLLILQKQIQEKGVLVLEDAGPPHLTSSDMRSGKEHLTTIRSASSTRQQSPLASASSVELQADHRTTGMEVAVPELFLLEGLRDFRPQVASLPSDVWVMGQEIPLDRWLFGQYNRLLPAKASCRALAHLLRSSPAGVRLSKATSRISDAAMSLGEFLANHDQREGIDRDDALATAFPTRGEAADKGRQRYANQFVASVNRNGQLSGLPFDLKLINYVRHRDPKLQLTEVGWQFVQMWNPVLDGSQAKPTQKFSAEETAFLLDHIAGFVPAEDFAYRTLLAAIASGEDTPQRLGTALQRYVSSDRKLTSSFLASQRSGAISRMTDLELVVRVRDGVRVSYVITSNGEQYAQRRR